MLPPACPLPDMYREIIEGVKIQPSEADTKMRGDLWSGGDLWVRELKSDGEFKERKGPPAGDLIKLKARINTKRSACGVCG